MLRIAHISDLHFCEPTLARALKEFADAVTAKMGRFGPTEFVEVHTASATVVDALRTALINIDPDVVAISGDITAFGDEASFAAFVQWCKTIAPRSGSRPGRKIIVVPGNHDALKDHFTCLRRQHLDKLPLLMRLTLRKYIRLLDPILPFLGRSWRREEHLSHFGAMIAANSWLTSGSVTEDVPDCPTVRVRLIPFITTASDPFWMNLGETRQTDWLRLRNEVREPSGSGAEVRIVVAHHNPVAPPSATYGRFAYAYNGMPEGTLFLSELQRAGVDFVLHGHQHEFSLLKFDSDHGAAGHAFAVGSDCSSDESTGGFNLLTVYDPNSAHLQRYRYRRDAGFTPYDSSVFLPLERHRPVDAETLSARYELKKYVYPSNDEEDEEAFGPVQEGSRGLVYMSGRHFKSVRESKFARVRQVLDMPKGHVRLLLMDPLLIGRLIDVQVGSKLHNGLSGDLWGRREELSRLVLEAEMTLAEVAAFVDSLKEDQKKRIDVRKSHTLLPFGAYVRHPDQPWGKMAVKILPIGAMGDLASPVLRLNRRADQALYDYYLNHLKYLFLKSTHVVGEWHDDDDLRDGMAPDVLRGLAGQAATMWSNNGK